MNDVPPRPAGTPDSETPPPPQMPPPPGPTPPNDWPGGNWLPEGVRGLRRSRSDRKVAGVCGGLGAYFDLDPLVFRVTLAVLAVFGGVGVLLYGLAWLLLPEEGVTESEGERLVRGRAEGSAIAAILAVLVGLTIFSGFLGRGFDAGGLVVLTVLGVCVVAAVRHGGRPGPVAATPAGPYAKTGAPGPASAYGQPGAYGQTPGTAYSSAPPAYSPAPPAYSSAPSANAPVGAPGSAYEPPPFGGPPLTFGDPPKPPRPPAERSYLSTLTVSVAFLVVGALLALGIPGSVEVDLRLLTAVVLVVLGAGLTVGAWVGRASGLVALGAVATVVLALSGAAEVPIRGGIGDRDWRPDTIAEVEAPHRLAVGEATLDLTDVGLAGRTTRVTASVGVGDLLVVVPDDVDLDISAYAGAGNLRMPDGDQNGGTDVEWDVSYDAEQPVVATGTLELDLKIGLGEVEVRREAS